MTTTITGTAGNDTLTANLSDVLVLALGGDDTLQINLENGYGNVVLDGGAGIDRLTLSSNHSNPNQVSLWVNLATGVVRVEDSSGNLQTQSVTLRGIESLYASKGWRGTLIGDDNDNELSFTDIGVGVLVGGKGNDTLSGVADTTADYSQTQGPVIASLANHSASSVDGIDTLNVQNLIGSAFDDVLSGDAKSNVLEGGKGNDTLWGAAAGEPGDTASYAHASGPVQVSLAAGRVTGADGVDELHGITGVIGSSFNDFLDASGMSQTTTLVGGAGNDTLKGGVQEGGMGDDVLIDGSATYSNASAAVQINLLTGDVNGTSSGHDALINVHAVFGTAFADSFIGSSQGDSFYGNGGADTVSGGGGDDFLENGVLLDGGIGNDQLRTYPVIDGRSSTLVGGEGNDVLQGAAAFFGGPGNDTLSLAAGWGNVTNHQGFVTLPESLTFDGGDGFDVLSLIADSAAYDLGRSTRIMINMASGELRINDEPTKTMVINGVEAIYDSKGWVSTLYGDGNDNILQGDTVFGGGGNDTLLWKTNLNAQLNGGQGLDTLRATELSDVSLQFTAASTDTNSVAIYRGGNLHATATSVERFVFKDRAVAVGQRAVEVAKIMFPLWNVVIANYTQCTGKGVDWYDHGHTFDEGIRYALSFFNDKSDAQLAAQLIANVPDSAGGYTAASLLALMASHGGGVGNIDGRAYATTLMANDAANVATIENMGLLNNGINCALVWGAEPLFVLGG